MPNRRGTLEPRKVSGPARVDARTKRVLSRVAPGDIVVIDHPDLDRVAAEEIVAAQPAAVVNASDSITGRYPNLGPLVVCAAGIPLLDGVGKQVMERVREGAELVVDGDAVLVDGEVVATGNRQSIESVGARIEAAKGTMAKQIEQFAANTLAYLREEQHLLVDDPDLPDLPLDFRGRHVLIVVRGADYKDDLRMLQRSGYLTEMRPVLVGVDGGADALLEIGKVPDLIIGDMDSVSEKALSSGAVLLVHAYADGRAPGAQRLRRLGLPYTVYAATGTSEDVAMLVAYEHGAELIVAVGAHSSMADFLDKGRAGMASTFLVRMKVGPILVDAKGVSRLYRNRVSKGDLALLVLSALFILVVIALLSAPVRLLLRSYWLTLTT